MAKVVLWKKSLLTCLVFQPLFKHILNNVLNLDIIFSEAEDTEVAVVVGVNIAVDRLRHITGVVDIHVRDLALTLHAVSTITGQIATRLHTYSYHKCK